jgi:hypothetical protein
MGMFSAKMGTWYVESKSDPRWDKSGRGYGLVSTGGPGEASDWLDYCRKQFGEPPKDTTMGFFKD